MNAGRLEPIVAAVRERAAERRRRDPLAQLEAAVQADPRRRERFLSALSRPELAFICELKRRSPSAGVLLAEDGESPGADSHGGPRWRALAHAYRAGGANALSILTEQDHFAGSLQDLRAAGVCGLPRLRKDFVIDEAMLLEACLYGADAVLLIAAILDDATLRHLMDCSAHYGLAVLLEVHDERELERAAVLNPDLIGVNARDLSTMRVDLATCERLLPRIPSSALRVAESGIKNIADLQRVRAAGADAVLIGETLMRSADPAGTLRTWQEALRGA